MEVGSEPDETTSLLASQYEPEEDPRCTTLGRLMRAVDGDELPQAFELYRGIITRWYPCSSTLRSRLYDPAIYHLIIFMNGKEDTARVNHRYLVFMRPSVPIEKMILSVLRADLFYAEHASLGFDLYIMYRAGVRVASKIEGKFTQFLSNLKPTPFDPSQINLEP